MIFLATIFVITFILFAVKVVNKRPKGIPPGEWGLPILGYFPFMDWRLPKTAQKLHRKHGDIFSLKLGEVLFIFVADYDLLKEAMSMPELSGRNDFFTHKLFQRNRSLGIITSEGHIWATNRRFALRSFRDFGFGKSSFEDIIQSETEYLINNLSSLTDVSCQIDWSLNVAILNIVWRLVADQRYNINDDEEVKKFSRENSQSLEDIDGPMLIFNFFPYLVPHISNLFKKLHLLRIKPLEERRERVHLFFKQLITKHRKSLDDQNPRDFIDLYLIETEKNKDNPDSAHRGDADLCVSLSDFFSAGSDTTSSIMRWFFAYMAKYQDAQRKVQKQLDEVIPEKKIVSINDKPRLPYVEALMHELQRVVALVPNAIPHEAVEEVYIGGYRIPKGSVVMPCTEIIHRSPKYWERPDEFDLEHFLDSDGNFVAKKEGYVPFSIGRRQCMGESLAKMEMFILMGSVLKNFEIHEPEGEDISLEPSENCNLMNYCREFKVILRKRL